MSHFQLNEEAIFDFARQIESPDLQAQYLDQACGSDRELKDRVAELLRNTGGSFLERPPADLAQTVEHGRVVEKEGDSIGPFKLLQRIGEGGFGIVYMAEQVRPVRRRVALKVIRPGMDSEAVIARFEAERQALAMMDHPNIARVIDGGATEEGRPYFVMELVKGVPITEFCDKNELTTDERIALFVTVCRAVQDAHQKGIIHRDLKPSNILVTLHDGKPFVKVIDFGVAKAINQQLTEKTLFTAFGQMVGTPQYMSPEQAEMSGLDVDTRSDVYSLGVILYELLTGSTPLEAERLRAAGYAEMQRLIKEEEPPRPSNRISTSGDKLTVIAKHRSIPPDRLYRQVEGDLDWIVMKTLEKDRNRRYESPSLLAQDLENHLHSEPVNARPPTWGYRASKYVRRHRVPLAFFSLLFASLLLGAGLFFWKASEAETHLGEISNLLLAQIMSDALGGDEVSAKNRLENIRSADVEAGDILLAQAVIEFIQGHFEEAAGLAQESAKLDSRLQGEEKVAARSLEYTSRFWEGTSVVGEYISLKDPSPQTDIDKLLYSFALMGNRPDRALNELESISSNVGRTGVGLLLRANCQSLMACDRRNTGLWRQSLYNVRASTDLLPKSELALTWLIEIASANAELAWQEGQTSDAQAILEEFAIFVDSMPRGPSTAYQRWRFYDLCGNDTKAEEGCLDASAKQGCCFLVAECFKEPTPESMMSRLKFLTSGKNMDTPWGRIIRGHVHSQGAASKESIIQLVRPVLTEESPLFRRLALTALCNVCEPEEVQKLAREARVPNSAEYELADDFWQNEPLINYLATGQVSEELDEKSNEHLLTFTNLCFTRGMLKLSEGEEDEAVNEFERAVLDGSIGTIDFILAKAYLSRLAPDRYESRVVPQVVGAATP